MLLREIGNECLNFDKNSIKPRSATYDIAPYLENNILHFLSKTFKHEAFPTLATDHLTINVDTEGVQTYHIFNLNGQSTQTGDFTEQKDLTINTLPNGIYFLKVGSEIIKFVKF